MKIMESEESEAFTRMGSKRHANVNVTFTLEEE